MWIGSQDAACMGCSSCVCLVSLKKEEEERGDSCSVEGVNLSPVPIYLSLLALSGRINRSEGEERKISRREISFVCLCSPS